eukprot:4377316-Amphidinium_carterae.1
MQGKKERSVGMFHTLNHQVCQRAVLPCKGEAKFLQFPNVISNATATEESSICLKAVIANESGLLLESW